MSPQLAPLVKLAGVALVLAAAFGAGWTVNGWRLGNDIERLAGKVAISEGANNRCAAAVNDVNTTLTGMREDEKKRAADAKVAVDLAKKQGQRHLDAVREALQRPAPDPGGECAAVAKEIRTYFDKRRAQ